jgi:hypothetical protein
MNFKRSAVSLNPRVGVRMFSVWMLCVLLDRRTIAIVDFKQVPLAST